MRDDLFEGQQSNKVAVEVQATLNKKSTEAVEVSPICAGHKTSVRLGCLFSTVRFNVCMRLGVIGMYYTKK